MMIFRNRAEAGRKLGHRLSGLELGREVLVLGLPRGGVPVAVEVAAALDAPVDVLVVRKLGAPWNPELAIGAVALGGVVVMNDDVLAELGIDGRDIEPIRARELVELARRERAYRGDRPPPAVVGKTVVIVDDGIATGATMHAAVLAARALEPKRIVVAAPTGARDSIERLERVADRVVTIEAPEPYYGVGAWYASFPQLTDAEVVAALEAAVQRGGVADRGTAAEAS